MQIRNTCLGPRGVYAQHKQSLSGTVTITTTSVQPETPWGNGRSISARSRAGYPATAMTEGHCLPGLEKIELQYRSDSERSCLHRHSLHHNSDNSKSSPRRNEARFSLKTGRGPGTCKSPEDVPAKQNYCAS